MALPQLVPLLVLMVDQQPLRVGQLLVVMPVTLLQDSVCRALDRGVAWGEGHRGNLGKDCVNNLIAFFGSLCVVSPGY